MLEHNGIWVMQLSSLEQYELEDALLESRSRVLRNRIICDGYGRTYDMKYNNWHRDPKPLVLVIGYWTHPSTGNRLLCGVNLNTLQGDQIIELRKVLPRILKAGKDAKSRYWAGRKLAPTIFKGAYRTYNTDHVDAVSPGTLRFWNEKADFRRERERMLQLEKERLLKKKAKKTEKLKKAERATPKPVQVKPAKSGKPPIKPKELPYSSNDEDLFDEIDDESTPKPVDPRKEKLARRQQAKLAKQKKAKRHRKQERLGKAVQKVLGKQRKPKDIPYESYINAKNIILGDQYDVAVYNIPTNQLITDNCDAVNIITNAGWIVDECITFERATSWSPEHCYSGYRPMDELAENVQYRIKAIMG